MERLHAAIRRRTTDSIGLAYRLTIGWSAMVRVDWHTRSEVAIGRSAADTSGLVYTARCNGNESADEPGRAAIIRKTP